MNGGDVAGWTRNRDGGTRHQTGMAGDWAGWVDVISFDSRMYIMVIVSVRVRDKRRNDPEWEAATTSRQTHYVPVLDMSTAQSPSSHQDVS